MRTSVSRIALALLAPLLLSTSCTDGPRHGASPTGPRLERTTGVRLLLVSGDGQTGVPRQPLPLPIVVQVVDQRGVAVAGATVNFLGAAGGSANPRQAQTDARGMASAVWTLGGTPGLQTLRVSGKGGTLLVHAVAVKGAVALVKVSGDGQTAAPGTRLAGPLVVKAVDALGHPVSRVAVGWAAGSGGSISPAATPTRADGTAQATWTLGAPEGDQQATATAPGLAPVTFTAHARPPQPPVGEPVAMYVLPNPMWLDVGDTARLRVVFLDAGRNVVPGPAPTFEAYSYYASVNAGGLVKALQKQAGGIRVRAGRFSAFVSVNPWRPQERYGSPRPWLYVVPEEPHLDVNTSVQLTALRVDAHGAVSTARTAAWRSLAPPIVSVSPTGLATARGISGVRLYAADQGLTGFADVYINYH